MCFHLLFYKSSTISSWVLLMLSSRLLSEHHSAVLLLRSQGWGSKRLLKINVLNPALFNNELLSAHQQLTYCGIHLIYSAFTTNTIEPNDNSGLKGIHTYTDTQVKKHSCVQISLWYRCKSCKESPRKWLKAESVDLDFLISLGGLFQSLDAATYTNIYFLQLFESYTFLIQLLASTWL